jgi:single-strand DNA-binding protein
MINKWIGIGNITRDIEASTTRTNKSMANFSIAINNKWYDNQGQLQEEVTYIECAAYGKSADIVSQYAQKGSKVAIEGRLKLDRWQAQDGSNRQKLRIVVEKIELLDSRSKSPGHHGHYEQQPPSNINDEDIPF